MSFQVQLHMEAILRTCLPCPRLFFLTDQFEPIWTLETKNVVCFVFVIFLFQVVICDPCRSVCMCSQNQNWDYLTVYTAYWIYYSTEYGMLQVRLVVYRIFLMNPESQLFLDKCLVSRHGNRKNTLIKQGYFLSWSTFALYRFGFLFFYIQLAPFLPAFLYTAALNHSRFILCSEIEGMPESSVI